MITDKLSGVLRKYYKWNSMTYYKGKWVSTAKIKSYSDILDTTSVCSNQHPNKQLTIDS